MNGAPLGCPPSAVCRGTVVTSLSSSQCYHWKATASSLRTASVPLSLALPATAAFLAYLDARFSISYDWPLVSSFVNCQVSARLLEYRDTLNLFYLLESHALHRKRSQHTFLIYQGKQWTYKQAYDIVLKYGSWLRKRFDVQKDEVVAMDFVNSEVFLWMWFGLWSIGAKPAFINYNLTGRPLLHSVKTSSARLMLVDEELKGNLTSEVMHELSSPDFQPSKGPVEVVFFSSELEAEILSAEGTRAPDSLRSGQHLPDLAMLIYTSGTTGLPKPAIVSWSKCIIGGYFIASWLPLTPSSILYTCMPLYHASAATLGVLSTLRRGSTLALGRRFSTTTFWADVRASRATIIQYVGETCRYLLSAPPSPLDRQHSVKTAFGNGLRPDVWPRFKQRFGIDMVAEFYAATEGPGGLFNRSRNAFGQGAVGRTGALAGLLLGTSTAVVAFDFEAGTPRRHPVTGLCVRAASDEPGELVYKLDAGNVEGKFQGYFNNRGASESKILRDVFKKGDAWFASGDVIRRDKEGRWWFVDRIGDTFRWKSENVSTAEVAEVLGMAEGVSEANVYGVQVPGHDGRAGCAAVVLKGELDERVLRGLATHVLSSLPKYAVPLFLRVTKSLQATGTNKQQKHALREEGVDPKRIAESQDKLFWLHGGTYEPFGQKEWESLQIGRLKL